MFEIGTTLRDARVRRDISLQQAEDETKIRVKYIQAMENEDFDIMPGGTYVKGFLRTYAEYLGLDYQLLVDEYNDRYGTGEHKDHIIQQTRTAKLEPAPGAVQNGATPHSFRNQKNRNYIFVAILAVAIIAVLAYLGWGNQSSNQPTDITTTETVTGTTTQPQQPAAPETAPPVETPATPPAEPATLESLVVESSEGDNWVEIRRNDASGEVIFADTLGAGENQSFDKAALAATKIWLSLGSTTGLQILVNGKPQQVPAGPVEVTMTAAGIAGQG